MSRFVLLRSLPSSPSSLSAALRLAVCVPSVLALDACVIMTPSPAVEALELVSAAAVNAAALAPGSAQNVVQLGDAQQIRSVCIEYNRRVEVPDFVPAMQAELARYGVESRVMDAGALPATCMTTLQYSALMQWDRRLFSSEYTPYLSTAELTLRDRGRVVSSASYRERLMSTDKWQSTQKKIAPLIEALLQRPAS